MQARSPRQIVLLHSPLVGPTSMAPTAGVLREMGFECAAPTQLRRGGDDEPCWRAWPLALLNQIGLVNSPIIVGHSMAGLLAARLASSLTAKGVICLDANIPPETGPTPPLEQSFRQILSSLPTEDGYLPPWRKWWPVDAFEGAPIAPDLRARVESEIPRLKLSWFDDEFEMPDWSQAKRAFIRTGKWFDQEADKAEARGWPVVRLAGTHLHPTTCPAETASAILQCIEAKGV